MDKKIWNRGESALSDRRGYHKSDEEVDELERLRRENLRLKRQLKEKDMAVELLKKVKEFERMWGSENNVMNQNIWQCNIFIRNIIGVSIGCVNN